jgi:phosphoglucomutase
VYAESFGGDAHLQKILGEARSIVQAALAEPRT